MVLRAQGSPEQAVDERSAMCSRRSVITRPSNHRDPATAYHLSGGEAGCDSYKTTAEQLLLHDGER
jgi:hypothetical protein